MTKLLKQLPNNYAAETQFRIPCSKQSLPHVVILARVFTFLSPFLPVVPLTVDYQKRRDPDTFERKRSTERQILGFPYGSDISTLRKPACTNIPVFLHCPRRGVKPMFKQIVANL